MMRSLVYDRQISNRTRIFYGWWVAAGSALALSMSVGPLLVYSFSLFVRPLGGEFGWTRGQVSVAIMLANLAVAATSPVLGRLLDTWGSRRVLLLGHIGLGTTAVLLSQLTPHVEHLYALYAVGGLLAAGSSPVPYARMVARWFTRQRGLALGLVMAGVGLGSFAVPAIVQKAITEYGWRTAYGWIGLLAVAVPVPLILFVLRESPREVSHAGQQEGMSRGEAMRSGVYWQMTAVFFVVAACSNGVVAHLAPMLSDAGMSAPQAAFAVSLFGASAVVGRIATGWLVDRFFAGRVVALMFVGLACGMGLLAAGKMGHVAAMLVGLGLGAEVDVMPYLISRYFGFRAFGEIYGFTFSAFTVGMAAGPVLMGYGFDSTGSYRTTLLMLIGVLGAAVVAAWLLPRYAGHKEGQDPAP